MISGSPLGALGQRSERLHLEPERLELYLQRVTIAAIAIDQLNDGLPGIRRSHVPLDSRGVGVPIDPNSPDPVTNPDCESSTRGDLTTRLVRPA